MNLLIFEKNKTITNKDVEIYLDHANNRLKIKEYKSIEENNLEEIKTLAYNEGLGKIICNCRVNDLETFRLCGFLVEGTIPGFFKGNDAYCVSYFVDEKRQVGDEENINDDVMSKCLGGGSPHVLRTYDDIAIKDAEKKDIPQMIRLFKDTFKTYPSPVFSADYLKNVLGSKTLFKIAVVNSEIISIASAEIDTRNKNAEITDCATDTMYRGKDILTNLIDHLEISLEEKGFLTLYSLSRAKEYGINIALSRMQYEYKGRLINNCNISGGFEDMNIWVKTLQKEVSYETN